MITNRLWTARFAPIGALTLAIAGCSGTGESPDDESSMSGRSSAPIVTSGDSKLISPGADIMIWVGQTIPLRGKCMANMRGKDFAPLPRWVITNRGGTETYSKDLAPENRQTTPGWHGTAEMPWEAPPAGRYRLVQRCYAAEENPPKVNITVNEPHAEILAPRDITNLQSETSIAFDSTCVRYAVTGPDLRFRSRWSWKDAAAQDWVRFGDTLAVTKTFPAGSFVTKLECLDSTDHVASQATLEFQVKSSVLLAQIVSTPPVGRIQHGRLFDLHGVCKGATKIGHELYWDGKPLFSRWSYRQQPTEAWQPIGFGSKMGWKPANASGIYNVQFECVVRESEVSETEVIARSVPISLNWHPRGLFEQLVYGRRPTAAPVFVTEVFGGLPRDQAAGVDDTPRDLDRPPPYAPSLPRDRRPAQAAADDHLYEVILPGDNESGDYEELPTSGAGATEEKK